jgi:hypothetical protein
MNHVYIESTTPDGNTISLRCGICGWTGDVPADQVEFPTNPDGSKDFRYLKATCGSCGACSTWPISGGAASSGKPELMALQQAFAHRLNHDPDHPAETPDEAIPAIKQMVEALGEGEKFALGDWEP